MVGTSPYELGNKSQVSNVVSWYLNTLIFVFLLQKLRCSSGYVWNSFDLWSLILVVCAPLSFSKASRLWGIRICKTLLCRCCFVRINPLAVISHGLPPNIEISVSYLIFERLSCLHIPFQHITNYIFGLLPVIFTACTIRKLCNGSAESRARTEA